MNEEVESYFGPVEENSNINYIPPDYSSDDESDNDFDEEATTEDEGELETFENEQEKQKIEPRKEMISTPFSDSGSGSPWGNNGGGSTSSSPWSQQQNSGSSIWGSSSRPSWGSGVSSGWGSSFGSGPSGGQKQEIPRQKSVVFCDLLDCLLETYQSNGLPGLKPRGL